MDKVGKMIVFRPHHAILLVLLLVGYSVASLAKEGVGIRIQVQEMGSSREEAERAALVTAVQQALTEFMREEAKKPEVAGRILHEFKNLRPNYKPLVKGWELDVDEPLKRGHLLEGRVVLDRDVLQLWSKKWLDDDSTGGKKETAKLKHRLSIYISPVSLEEGDLSTQELERRKDFMRNLKNRLDRRGYDIKQPHQKAQAQYVVKLVKSKFDQRGLRGSMVFAAEILENRADGSVLATAIGSAEASLETTDESLRQQLSQEASIKVAAELHREFEAISTQSLEVMLYASKSINRRRAGRALVDGLADIYGILTDDEFDHFEDVINEQVTKERDHYLFSYRIPTDYTASHRDWKERLAELHGDVLGGRDVQVSSASAGKKWIFYDAADKPAGIGQVDTVDPWVVKVESLIRAGKLDNPPGIGANALDTVRNQLGKDPENSEAHALLTRIADVYVRRAYDAMDASQTGQAGRYLNRAEYVLGDLSGKALKSSRQTVKQAHAKLSQQAKKRKPPKPDIPAGVPDTALTAVVSDKPQIVFPDLEAKLRGLKRHKVKQVIALAADPDGVSRITANGNSIEFKSVNDHYRAYLDLPGAQTQQFSLPQSLLNGSGRIEVSVTDTKGNTSKRAVQVVNGKASVVVESGFQAGRDVVEKGRYWALLIGNQNYTNGVPSLETPHHDVDHLKQVLIKNYGFASGRVKVIKDASRQQMRVALDRLHEQVKGHDSLLIYYAGHGYQDKGFGGKGFWIPVDGISPLTSEASPRTTWLPNSVVYDILQASRAKHILLISDSCYSGTFKTRSIGEPSGFAANVDFFYTLAGKESRRAITSGDLEPVADGGTDGHSVFAYHLIKQLETSSSTLNAEQLYQRLRRPVVTGSNQHPQYFTIQGAGDEGGDFVFVPK